MSYAAYLSLNMNYGLGKLYLPYSHPLLRAIWRFFFPIYNKPTKFEWTRYSSLREIVVTEIKMLFWEQRV